MHNQFGQTVKKSERDLTDERLNLIVINAVVPTVFAYGRAKAREDFCDLAFDLMEQCKAERDEPSAKPRPVTRYLRWSKN